MLWLAMDLWSAANDVLEVVAATVVRNRAAEEEEPVRYITFPEFALSRSQLDRLKETEAFKELDAAAEKARQLRKAEKLYDKS